MQNGLSNPTALAGRILLAVFFIMSGFGKVTGFDATVGYIASKGLPMPSLLAVLAILAELGGGVLIVIGLFTRWAALALALFCVVAAVLFHPFWSMPAASQMGDQINFMKNITIAGGMLVLAAFGPGSISFDARRPIA